MSSVAGYVEDEAESEEIRADDRRMPADLDKSVEMVEVKGGDSGGSRLGPRGLPRRTADGRSGACFEPVLG
jgi:hypothetical protein